MKIKNILNKEQELLNTKEKIIDLLRDESIFYNFCYNLSPGSPSTFSKFNSGKNKKEPLYIYNYNKDKEYCRAEKYSYSNFLGKDHIGVQTYEIEKKISIKKRDEDIVNIFVKEEKKYLLNFLNILYNKNFKNLKKYNIDKMKETGMLFGYFRNDPNILIDNTFKLFITYEELALGFEGEPLEHMEFVL